MEAIDAKHYTGGGVYAKEWKASFVGDVIEQHVHKHDHLSYLAVGRVLVDVDGMPELAVVVEAPTAVTIRAGYAHRIVALSDNVLWLCIHAIPPDLRGDDIEGSLRV